MNGSVSLFLDLEKSRAQSPEVIGRCCRIPVTVQSGEQVDLFPKGHLGRNDLTKRVVLQGAAKKQRASRRLKLELKKGEGNGNPSQLCEKCFLQAKHTVRRPNVWPVSGT